MGNKSLYMVSNSEIETILNDAAWDFCRKAERVVRPYTTSDFIREYFIPDL